MTTHLCPDGEHRRGDEFDCGFCRAWLLNGFRTPAPAPAPSLTVTQPGLTGRLDPNRCPFCDQPRAYMDEHVSIFHPDEYAAFVAASPPVHLTDYGTEPDPDQPGGDWYASCSCGWTETGHYVRDGGQPMAERLARIKADEHRKHPEPKDTDQ